MTDFQLILFWIALVVALYGHISYGIEIPKRTLRPKAMTWLIWGVLSTCVAVIQLRHGAGLGSIGAITGAVSGYILAATAWVYGHRHIHEADIVSIVLALAALICWGVFGDTVAVVLSSFVYLVGFIPTLVRGWKAPHNERITPFVTATLKYVISLMILQAVSLETATYPLVLAVANLAFAALLFGRRQIIQKKTTK